MGNSFIDTLLSQKGGNVRISCFADYHAESVMKAVCAYLNNEGGWIIVGVSEDGKRKS